MELEYDFFPLIAGELGATRESSKHLQAHLDKFLPVYKVHAIIGWFSAPDGTANREQKTAVLMKFICAWENVFAHAHGRLRFWVRLNQSFDLFLSLLSLFL